MQKKKFSGFFFSENFIFLSFVLHVERSILTCLSSYLLQITKLKVLPKIAFLTFEICISSVKQLSRFCHPKSGTIMTAKLIDTARTVEIVLSTYWLVGQKYV